MAVKTRWDQKTYRRHMFNKGRGVRSPHDTSNTKVGTAEFVDSKLGEGSWWEASWRSPWAGRLDAAKEYEQYNNPASAGWSPFTLDSTERKQFREQDRKEVRDLFQKQLANHHFLKHKKLTGGQLDKIVDAYMSQDDDKFQATLAGMGFSDKDAGRVRRAAEDSATAAIEGTAYGTKWDDDDYAKQSGAKPGTAATGNQPGQAGQGGAVANGQPKAGQLAADQPLARRGAPKNEPVGQGMTGRRSTRAGYGHVSWNGAAVPQSNNAAQANVAGIVAAETQAGRDRAEAAAQVQRAVSSHAPSEAYQESMNERDRVEQMGRDRRARQAAEREAAARQRADKRYESRTLYNEDDWKNLGREGSNRANYAAEQQAGETTDQYKARQKSIADRDARLAALVKRMDDMGVQDAEKNSFYANDPNKQQNLARLRGLVDKAGKGITDAQMEGVNATLDAWEKGAAEKGARNAALREMSKAEEVSRLRDLYGLQYTGAGGYTGDEVLKFHQDRQAEARKKILQGMQVAPGMTPNSEETTPSADQRPAAMQKFSQDWQKLIDNGFNPTATFQEAMTKGGMRDAYDAGMKALDVNDPDYRDKADQLRRRFTVQYAMQQAGVGGEGGAERGKAGARFSEPAEDDQFSGQAPGDNARQMGRAMAQNLPGSAVTNPREAVNIENPLPPRKASQTPGVQIVHSMEDAIKARDTANAAAGIPLKKKRTDGGMLS